LGVSDNSARSFYEKEAINLNWSVRELRRQIDTSLFQRLLLSDGNANKEKVLSLANEGIIISKPNDIQKVRDIILLWLMIKWMCEPGRYEFTIDIAFSDDFGFDGRTMDE